MALKNPLLPATDPSTEAIPAPAADALTGADIQRLQHSLDSSVVSEKHPEDVRLRLATVLPGLDPGPRQPLPARFAPGRCRLPRPPGRGQRPLGRHHPAAQGRPGRRPQDPRPRRPHRPRGVRRIMKGIARTHGRSQRQAKPLTAEALAAVRATASTRRPCETARSRNQHREFPRAARQKDPHPTTGFRSLTADGPRCLRPRSGNCETT